MAEIMNGSCSPSELKSVAALFYKKLSADPVFRAAFPDPAVGRAHCHEFVSAYAREGEIHRVTEDGALAAAALWSLPGQAVPSPTWDFEPEEPCFPAAWRRLRPSGLRRRPLRRIPPGHPLRHSPAGLLLPPQGICRARENRLRHDPGPGELQVILVKTYIFN